MSFWQTRHSGIANRSSAMGVSGDTSWNRLQTSARAGADPASGLSARILPSASSGPPVGVKHCRHGGRREAAFRLSGSGH